jgi:hypothetical protein
MVTIYAYERGKPGVLRKDVSQDELPALLARDDVTLWVDLFEPS